MKSAARSKLLAVKIITCDGRIIDAPWKKEETQDTVLPAPVSVVADVHHTVDRHMKDKSEKDALSSKTSAVQVHRRPSFTPSLGSKDSDHETLVNTVEVAAYLGRSSLRYSSKKIKGKVCKTNLNL